MGGSCCGFGFGCGCVGGGSGRGWWRLSEPLVKDKDLKGWVCGGVSASVSGVGEVGVVGLKSMAW